MSPTGYVVATLNLARPGAVNTKASQPQVSVLAPLCGHPKSFTSAASGLTLARRWPPGAPWCQAARRRCLIHERLYELRGLAMRRAFREEFAAR